MWVLSPLAAAVFAASAYLLVVRPRPPPPGIEGADLSKFERKRWFDEEEISQDLSGKFALVTGASSGIGKAVARGLYLRNCTVVLTSRRLERAVSAAQEFEGLAGGGLAVPMALDLSSLEDVRRFESSLWATSGATKLDFVVLNAGMGPLFEGGVLGKALQLPVYNGARLSAEGFEMLYASNYLGHFLLLQLLLEGQRLPPGSRVSATSSIMHWVHDSDLQTLLPLAQRSSNAARPVIGQFKAYGNTKLLQVLMCFEAQRRYGRAGITFTPLAPGLINTAIGRQTLELRDGTDDWLPGALSSEHGARTTLHALLSAANEGSVGVFLQPYWSPLHQQAPLLGGLDVAVTWEVVFQRLHWGLHTWKPHPDAFNESFAEELWDASVVATRSGG